MTYTPGAGRVSAQVDGMLMAVEAVRPGRLAALRNDALSELAGWDGVELHIVDSAPYDAGCQVAGSYERRGDVAHLTIARAASRPRQQFSVLHELGHALQRTHRNLTRALAEEPDDGRRLEERACDEFAARVLLPEDLLDGHIAAAGPTAAAVAALMRSSSASRQACCVAASRRLRSPGHVLLLDDTGRVLFAASVGLPRPVRDSDQRGCTLISAALQGKRAARVDGAQLHYRDDDWLGEELFGDAAWHGNYLIAVLVTDHIPWGGLAVREYPTAAGPTARMWDCEGCGELFPNHDRCARCRQPQCPQCGHCSCAKQATTTCSRCFLTLSYAEQQRGADQHDECP